MGFRRRYDDNYDDLGEYRKGLAPKEHSGETAFGLQWSYSGQHDDSVARAEARASDLLLREEIHEQERDRVASIVAKLERKLDCSNAVVRELAKTMRDPQYHGANYATAMASSLAEVGCLLLDDIIMEFCRSHSDPRISRRAEYEA